MTNNLDTGSIDMDGRYLFSKAAEMLGIERRRMYMYAKMGLIDYYYNAVGRKVVTGAAISEFWRRVYDPKTGKTVLLVKGERPASNKKSRKGNTNVKQTI